MIWLGNSMLSSIVQWVAVLLPTLLGLLSFTAFVGDVRKQTGPGRFALTRSGKVFLTLGFLGFIGTVVVATMGRIDSIASASQIASIENDLSALIKKNGALARLNEDLKKSHTALTKQNDDLFAVSSKLMQKNELLQNAMDEVLSQTRSSDVKLDGLASLSDRA